MSEKKWISFEDEQPKSFSNIEVSSDGGETVDNDIEYMEDRTCMLAGSGGGNGYFGAGWAMNGTNGCDRGLISESPTHWRLV